MLFLSPWDSALHVLLLVLHYQILKCLLSWPWNCQMEVLKPRSVKLEWLSNVCSLNWVQSAGQSLHVVLFLLYPSHSMLSPTGREGWVSQVGPDSGKLLPIFKVHHDQACMSFFSSASQPVHSKLSWDCLNLIARCLWHSRAAADVLLPASLGILLEKRESWSVYLHCSCSFLPPRLLVLAGSLSCL